MLDSPDFFVPSTMPQRITVKITNSPNMVFTVNHAMEDLTVQVLCTSHSSQNPVISDKVTVITGNDVLIVEVTALRVYAKILITRSLQVASAFSDSPLASV